VLAVLHIHVGISFGIVEILACVEGYFADPV